jgi:hypothetical protein
VSPDADRAMVRIPARAAQMLEEMRAGEDRQREEDGGERDGADGPPERDEKRPPAGCSVGANRRVRHLSLLGVTHRRDSRRGGPAEH